MNLIILGVIVYTVVLFALFPCMLSSRISREEEASELKRQTCS